MVRLRIDLSLTAKQHRFLLDKAEEYDLPLAEVIREFIVDEMRLDAEAQEQGRRARRARARLSR